MKSAVLVIDVQAGLFDPAPQPFESEAVLARINRVTAWARTQKIPVIFIQHERPGTALEYASNGWQLQGTLQIEPSDYRLRKTTPDSFLRTDLAEKLTPLGIEHLFICGYASEFCVDTTVRRAAGLGYSVTLVADAHTTHDKAHTSGGNIRDHHNATLTNISSFDVKIMAIATESLTAENKPTLRP